MEELFERMEDPFEWVRRLMATQWAEPWADADAPLLPAGGSFESNVTLESVEDGLVVLADLPGFEREEIAVRITDGRLTITADHESAGDAGYRSRRVTESVILPGAVDLDDAEATYRNGVLEIHLPLSEDADDIVTLEVE